MKTNDQGLLSYVESNFDEQMLGQLIWDIQELYILPIVGTALYDELRTQIQAGTLTASNQTLLFEKINPALMWHLLSKGAHIFTYKIRNKGIVTQRSDNSQPATMSELDRMVKQFESFAQTYSDRLMKYLMCGLQQLLNPDSSVARTYQNEKGHKRTHNIRLYVVLRPRGPHFLATSLQILSRVRLLRAVVIATPSAENPRTNVDGSGVSETESSSARITVDTSSHPGMPVMNLWI